MAQYTSYWSCSKLADLIRGAEKPCALDWEAWDTWHKDAESAHPIRYWLAETGLSKLQDSVYFPLNLYADIYYYIRNRFIDKSHYLKTGLKPGQFHETDTKILHGCFSELVEFVEVQKAGMEEACNESKGAPRELGLKYLDWEIGLTDSPGQAEAARKVKALYLWWQDFRPKRIDPFDWEHREEEEYHARYAEVDWLTKVYEDEDTEMLISLIKLRRSLWT